MDSLIGLQFRGLNSGKELFACNIPTINFNLRLPGMYIRGCQKFGIKVHILKATVSGVFEDLANTPETVAFNIS